MDIRRDVLGTQSILNKSINEVNWLRAKRWPGMPCQIPMEQSQDTAVKPKIYQIRPKLLHALTVISHSSSTLKQQMESTRNHILVAYRVSEFGEHRNVRITSLNRRTQILQVLLVLGASSVRFLLSSQLLRYLVTISSPSMIGDELSFSRTLKFNLLSLPPMVTIANLGPSVETSPLFNTHCG